MFYLIFSWIKSKNNIRSTFLIQIRVEKPFSQKSANGQSKTFITKPKLGHKNLLGLCSFSVSNPEKLYNFYNIGNIFLFVTNDVQFCTFTVSENNKKSPKVNIYADFLSGSSINHSNKQTATGILIDSLDLHLAWAIGQVIFTTKSDREFPSEENSVSRNNNNTWPTEKLNLIL